MTAMQTVGPARPTAPSANVTETPIEYVVELDVSDFALSELSVELDDREVTIVGEQQEPVDHPCGGFRLRERLVESFPLPDDADGEWLTALFEHGTLELHAPKLGPCPRGRRRVPILRKGQSVINPDATPC